MARSCDDGPAAASTLAWVLSVALAGCGGAADAGTGEHADAGSEDGGEPGKLVSELEPGLRLLDAEQADQDGHLVEALVHEGYVHVANSLGIVTMRLDDDGGLTMTDNGKQAAGQWTSCTTLAIDRPSDTLYCSADGPSMGEPRVERYDLSDPAAPVLREPFFIEQSTWAVRNLEVIGDTLYISQFDAGLWTAQIGPGGELSGLSQAPVAGNVRFVVELDGVLVAALADLEGPGTELRVLAPETFAELGSLGLDGPPLGLTTDASGAATLAVALGSGGMALVDLALEAGADPDAEPEATLSVRGQLSPPAVVSHAIVSGELAFAVTLSGVFGYELDTQSSGEGARLFGFGPESSGTLGRDGNMLHALIHEGELLTSDWTWVQRWAIEPAGEALALDVPRGVYVPPIGPVRWRLRNPGPVALRAEHWAGSRHLFDVEMGPESVELVELDPVARATILERDEPSVTLALRVHDPSVDSEGQPLSTSTMMILQREPDDPLPPAVGELLTTTVTLADVDKQLFTLPPGERASLVWYSPDCALMWPEFEDLAWWTRRGEDLGRGLPIYISENDVGYGFARRWGLEAVRFGLFGHQAPPEVDEANAAFGANLLEVFIVDDLPGNADVSDYVIDADGRVLSIERMYRGPWSLAEPAPWK